MTGYFESRRENMLAFVPVGVSSVLDVGCGAGGFLDALRAREPAAHIEGIEANEVAAATARATGFTVTTGSFPDTRPTRSQYGCIVFNDVLEHMIDPWIALRVAHRLMAPDGRLVVSVPNVRNLATLSMLIFRGEWSYVDAGVLDRTHLRFFTRSSLEQAITDAGFAIETIVGAWPLTTWKMRVLHIVSRLGGASLYREARHRQWNVTARPALADRSPSDIRTATALTANP